MAKTTTDAAKAAKHLKGKSNGGDKHLVILMDESGSMAQLEESVITGTNEFLHAFRDDKNVLVTLAWFDHHPGEPHVRFKVKAKPVSKVKDLKAGDYNPRGLTPLNDAIIETIDFVDGKVNGDESTVFFAIITDGKENKSEVKDPAVIAKLIKKHERKGWGFVYLGANQQAEAVASQMGLRKKGKAFNFPASPGGMKTNTSTVTALAQSRMAAGPGAQGLASYESVASETYDKTGGKLDEEDSKE